MFHDRDVVDSAERGIWLEMAEYERQCLELARHPSPLVPTIQQIALVSITHIVTHAEICAIDVLIRCAEDLDREGRLPRSTSLEDAKRRITNNWDGREEFTKACFQVSWRSYGWYRTLQGFVEARNAWVHGRGRLTSRQVQGKASTYLQDAKLSVINGGLMAEEADVWRCARSAISFVRRLDDLRSKGPSGHGD